MSTKLSLKSVARQVMLINQFTRGATEKQTLLATKQQQMPLVRSINTNNVRTKGTAVNTKYLNGVFPSICTPFERSREERIAYAQLENNIKLWEQQAFAGYAIHDVYGEFPFLTTDERIEMVMFMRRLIDSKKTLIVGAGFDSLKKTIFMCELLAKMGANYALLKTPSYYDNQMNDLALYHYFTKVADESPIPVILHNLPSQTGIDMSVDLCVDLAAHPNIVALSEGSTNIAKAALVCQLIAHKKQINNDEHDFCVLATSASHLLDFFKAGCTGAISGLASVLGPQILQLYHMQLNERIADEKKHLHHDDDHLEQDNASSESSPSNQMRESEFLQNKLIEFDQLMRVYGIPGLKASLDLMGYYGGPCRSPLLELNSNEVELVKESLIKGNFLAPCGSKMSSSLHELPFRVEVFRTALHHLWLLKVVSADAATDPVTPK